MASLQSFSHKSNLTSHTRIHTGEKPFECSICSQSFRYKHHLAAFSDKSNLTRHTHIHSKEKPFKCSICSLAFSDKSNLTRHTRIHTREKPFKCLTCSLAFSHKLYLTRHTRIHTGEKPFKLTKVLTKQHKYLMPKVRGQYDIYRNKKMFLKVHRVIVPIFPKHQHQPQD
ncbi:zinc finger protein OZF-like [Copidosoma floridanum]|uniref:zinc finger protein OZF-like n=1 Tax=Copidosoma floridanum TaxID=29053 RepID=UPI000C6F50FE|nr:zinc finger protein OZF-like [Copidosoma floridanum]